MIPKIGLDNTGASSSASMNSSQHAAQPPDIIGIIAGVLTQAQKLSAFQLARQEEMARQQFEEMSRNPKIRQRHERQIQQEQRTRERQAQQNAEVNAEMLRQMAERAQSGQPIRMAAPCRGRPAPRMVPARHPAQMDPNDPIIVAAREQLNKRLAGGPRTEAECQKIRQHAAEKREREWEAFRKHNKIAVNNSKAAAQQIKAPFVQAPVEANQQITLAVAARIEQQNAETSIQMAVAVAPAQHPAQMDARTTTVRKREREGEQVAEHNSEAAALQVGGPFIQVQKIGQLAAHHIGKRARIEGDPCLGFLDL